MLKAVFKYARHGFIRNMILLITLEQTASAGVTALLALAGRNLTNPGRFIVFVAAFMIVSQIPALVQIFVRRTETRGYLDMYFNFLDDRLISRAGRPHAWASRGQREKYLTAIGPEANTYLTSIAYTWFDTYSYLLNIILNTMALALVIDGDYSWIFLLSMAISYLVFHAQKNSLHEVVEREQVSRLEFSAYILKAWDNLLLRNAPVHQKYVSGLHTRFDVSREQTGRSAFKSSLTIFWVGIASAIPVFALNLYLPIAHSEQAGLIAAMMITLPRQLQILGFFRAFFVQLTNLKMFTVRFQTAFNNSELHELDFTQHIDYSKIIVNGRSYSHFDELFEEVGNLKSGRMLISGENGAGKSSLLLLLNSNLKNSFYLPTAPQFEIGKATAQASTGQTLLMHIEFVAAKHIPVLLLDEWDANLDAPNRAEISAELDRLSLSRLIIEVRH
ncbi:MAG: hypothetical protein ACXVA9_05920 [Bdellovibrionales bacterium]